MSENLNISNEPTVDHVLIPCVQLLESVHSDKTDGDFGEILCAETCMNSSMDISEPIGNCDNVDCFVMPEENTNHKELEMGDIENRNDDNLMDNNSENTFGEIVLDTNGGVDNESALNVSNVQNKITETHNATEVNIDKIDQVINEGMADLSSIEVLKSIGNNDSVAFNDEEIALQEITSDLSTNLYHDFSVNEENLNKNNIMLNNELCQAPNDFNESPMKTSSRPQRQAAKKAENQIREIAKEIIKPLDIVDENIIDTIEGLSSPLKKVCCQCNRFRFCKFSVKFYKSMYLCQEECVENYRRKIDQCNIEKKCEQCLSVISESKDRSFCWQTKHFCSVDCLSHYQNTILDSNCTNCHEPIKSDADLGKYCRYISRKILQFCGITCIESYENKLIFCSFCQKELVALDFEEFCSSFCQTKDYESRKRPIEPESSNVDFVANETTEVVDKCKVCFNKLISSSTDDFQIFSCTNALFKFCSNECLNKFIVSKRKTVSCAICKIKKYNFDMISNKKTSSNIPAYICSLNCLLQQELLDSKSKKVICDKCGLLSQVLHKTFNNATVYNFCSQNCLNLFQSCKKPKSKSKSKNAARVSTRHCARKEDSTLSDSDGIHNSPQKTPKVKSKASRKISYVDTNVLPKVDKEIQTDQTGSKGVIIPVPVPVYIPMPMHMYSMPYPVPVPMPIPLPIPIFIPTTRNTTKGILKDIKKIKEQIPSDPFEAELLMMAGMVANDRTNENNSSSDSENDVPDIEFNDDTKVVSSSAHNHNSFGDDVLAMALNMAGADTESLEGVDELSSITSDNQTNQMIDDVEANLVSSTIMLQTPNPIDNITQENMISSPQDMLGRPPRKRAPRTQSQRTSNSKRSRKNEYSQVPCTQLSTELMQQPQQQIVQNPLFSIPMSGVKPDANMSLKYTLGVNAWRQWACIKSIEFEKTFSNNVKKTNIFKLDLLKLTASELNYCLCLFVKEVRKPNGSEYASDTIYYLCLGIQQYLYENGRIDNIFTDLSYEPFTDTLNEIAKRFPEIYNDTKYIITRVEEEYLWESKQLGAHSPHVLLSTLIFFNTKHFNLTSVEEHMQLSFSHIMKHWKRNPNYPSAPGVVKAPGTYRNVLLRFYPPQAAIDSPNSRKKKVYEQHENEENPLRCPVKLYEFFLSKCPESVKTRNDLFYLTPERSCVPDSPVWYSTCTLNKESLEKMLNRVKMVKEINVALLSS